MYKATVFVLVLITISACQQVPKDSNGTIENEYTKITETELAMLYNKTLTIDQSTLIVRNDGSFDGMASGVDPLEGTWEMRDGFWCRVITVSNTFPTGKEDCQLWERNGNKIKGTRNKGKGNSFLYTIE